VSVRRFQNWDKRSEEFRSATNTYNSKNMIVRTLSFYNVKNEYAIIIELSSIIFFFLHFFSKLSLVFFIRITYLSWHNLFHEFHL